MAAPIKIEIKLDPKDIGQAGRQIKSALDRELAGATADAGATGRRIGNALFSNLKVNLEKIGPLAKQTGTALTTAVTLPILGIGAAAIKVGFDFEKSMNELVAATKPTNEQLRQATALAKQLGNDLSLPAVSANDAASAMTTLAKAGLTLDQAMAAVKGSLQLATAAGIDAAKAAEIQADAINTFKLQASDAGRVADLLSASANNTSGEITDVAAALKQAGAAAALLRIPIEDTVTALGLLAQSGVRGSDAGTSLKAALVQLTSPTKEAAATMKRLGLEFFDAQGKLKPLRELVEDYTTKTANLTDQQKLQVATTLAGTDGQRALNLVLGGGVEAYDKIKTATTASGEAQRIAAEKTKGAVGQWEALKSQLETLGLTVFELSSGPLLFLLQTLNQLVGVLAGLPEPVQATIIAVAGVAAAIGPLLVLLGTLISSATTIAGLFGVELVISVTSVTGLFTSLGATLGGLVAATGPFGLAIIAAGALAAGLYYLANAETTLTPVTLEQVNAHAKQVEVIDSLIPKVKEVGNATFFTKEEQLALKQAYDLLNPAAQERINQLSKERIAADALTQELEKLKAESLKDLTIDGTATVAEFVKIQQQIEQTRADIELFRSSKDNAFKTGDLRGIQFFQEEIKKTQGLLKEQEKALGDTVVKLEAISKASGQNARDFAIEAQTRGLIKDYQAVATAIETFQGKLKENARIATEAAKQLGDGTKNELSKTALDVRKIGADFGAGLAAGINSPESRAKVSAAANSLADLAEKGVRVPLQVKSPSVVMMGIGVDIAAGLAIGIERNASAPVAATRQLADGMLTTARLKGSEIKKALKEIADDSKELVRQIAEFSNPQVSAAKNKNEDLQRTLELTRQVFDLQRELRALEQQPSAEDARLKAQVTEFEKLKSTMEEVLKLRKEFGIEGTTVDRNKAAIELFQLRNRQRDRDRLPEISEADASIINAASGEFKRVADLQEQYSRLADTLKITTAAKTEYERVSEALAKDLKGLSGEQKAELLLLAQQKDAFEQAQREAEQYQQTMQEVAQAVGQSFSRIFTAFTRDGFKGGLRAISEELKNFAGSLLSQIIGGFSQRLANSVVGAIFGGGSSGGNAGGGLLSSIFGGIFGGGNRGASSASGGGGILGSIFGGGSSGGLLGNIFGSIFGRGGTAPFNPNASSGGGLFGNLFSGIKNLFGGGIQAPASISTRSSSLGSISSSALGAGGVGSLKNLFSGFGFGAKAGSGGALAGLAPLLGIGLGSSLGGQSSLGRLLGGIGGGLVGIGLTAAPAALAGATGGLSGALAGLFSNPITAVVGGALLVGSYFLGKAKQRKADEKLVDTYWVEYMNKTKALTDDVNADRIEGSQALKEALAAREEAIALISQIKTKSVRESRLANQIPDVDRLFLEPLKAAIEAQKKRAKVIRNIIPEFATGGVVPGIDLGYDSVLAMLRPTEVILTRAQQARIRAIAGSDIFGRAGVPGFGSPNSALQRNGLPAYAMGGVVERPVLPAQSSMSVTLAVSLEVGTEDQTKIFINGARSTDGRRALNSAVKTSRRDREL